MDKIIQMLLSSDDEMIRLGVELAFKESEEWRKSNLPYNQHSENCLRHNGTIMVSFRKNGKLLLFGREYIYYRDEEEFDHSTRITEL